MQPITNSTQQFKITKVICNQYTATINQIDKHIMPKSHPHILSLILFSELRAFASSCTVFFVFYLDTTILSSILFIVSPYSTTISLSGSLRLVTALVELAHLAPMSGSVVWDLSRLPSWP